MRNIQEIFERIQESKKKQRDIKAMYKESLDNLPEFRLVNEKLEELKKKRREIEYKVQEELRGYFEKYDLLKVNINGDTAMLNDIAITQFMKGERITLTDSYNNTYEPILSVKFKKGEKQATQLEF